MYFQPLLAGAGSWVFPGASLDFDFANGRYYQQGQANNVDQLITVSRASTGYASDTAGNWDIFANNVARITNQGLLVEEARTNLALNNSTFSGWSTASGSGPGAPVVSSTTDVRPDGTTGTVVTLAYPAVAAGFSIFFFNPAVAHSTNPFAGSIFIKGSAPGAIYLNLEDSGAAPSGGNFIAGSLASFGTTWTRISTAGTYSSGAGNVGMVLGFDNRAAVQTNAAPFTIEIYWGQIEAGLFPTSPIPTTAASVTRAADVVTVTTPPVLGSLYSLFAKGTPQAPTSYTTSQILLQVDDGTSSNRNILFRNSNNGAGTEQNVSGGTSAVITGGVLAQNTVAKMAASITSGAQALSINGSAVGTQTGTLPVGVVNIRIGTNSGGTVQGNMYLQEVAIFTNNALSNATLQAITT